MAEIHSKNKIANFQKTLLLWYNENGRNFPWRDENISQYQLIIAEIMLQRTKAETVALFFPKFITKYSNWRELARTSELELQTALKPIGLYRQRGSRLYNLAREIDSRNGIFPKERNELEELPLMGQYLVNAYELYFLNKRKPLLDVNMSRVLERIFGSRTKKDIRYDPFLQEVCKRVVNHKYSKEINWAILDFAALVCTLRNPKCKICVLTIFCKK